MLKIENITYAYGNKKQPVLKDYSLQLGEGTICGLLGRNGAGKSTLLYLICGLLKPQGGTVDYNGYTPFERAVPFLDDVFIVPEEYSLPNVKLIDYVRLNAPFYPKFSQEHFNGYLKTFEMDPDAHLGQLSMGQKKRILIAFALATNTSLLILDEPTNGLDIHGKRLFRKALLASMTDDKTVIVSTHQVHDVENILDRVVITDTSGVLLDATTAEICRHLAFSNTTDRERAGRALFSLDVPGGMNIVEPATQGEETDINLESLFELATERPDVISKMFAKR